MTRDEVIEELKHKLYDDDYFKGFHMMGTQAYHQLGRLSKAVPELCFIYNETKDHYVGAWITGFDMREVLFPKKTTKDLTPRQIKGLALLKIEIKERNDRTEEK